MQPPGLAALVRLQGASTGARTEPHQGRFKLPWPEPAQAVALALEVELPGYSVCVPGEVQVPASQGRLKPPVAVLLVEEGKEAECGRRVAVGIAEQVVSHWPRGLKPRPLKPASLVESWARLHDLGVEQVQAVLAAWALQVQGGGGEGEWERALAALVTGNPGEAVRLAEGVARQGQEQLGRQGQEQGRVLRGIASAYNLQGVAHNASGEYARALEAYGQVPLHITRQEEPRLWAAAMSGAGFAHAALSRVQRDDREHIESAVHSYRQALAASTRERSPREWAAMESVLGVALMWKAGRPGEAVRVEDLDEAIKLLRESLEVYTPSHTPQGWALSQSSLGAALQVKSQGLEELARARLLEESVALLGSVQELCTQEDMPWECALSLVNLGNALRLQGEGLQGDAGLKRLQEATKALEGASGLYEREQMWEGWAHAQAGLGNVLTAQGKVLAGEAGVERLRAAVEAYQRAREVYEREQLWDEWAGVQLNLCVPLENLTVLVGGRVVQELAKAQEDAARGALRVYTRERRPKHWAIAKASVAKALMTKARALVAESLDEASAQRTLPWLGEARGALQEALTVVTPDGLPEAWAIMQSHLCVVLLMQSFLVPDLRESERLAAEAQTCREAVEKAAVPRDPWQEALDSLSRGVVTYQESSNAKWQDKGPLLEKAEALFRRALRGLERGRDPENWASAHIHLGITLRERADRAGVEEKLRLLEQAEAAFREALQVYKLESHPAMWALAQHDLGYNLSARGPWLRGEDAAVLLQEAVQRIHEALKFYTYEKRPQEWASAQLNLSFALSWLGRHVHGEAGVQRLREAVRACNEALRVFTPETYPKEWARARRNITKGYQALLERAGLEGSSATPPGPRELDPPPRNLWDRSVPGTAVRLSRRPAGPVSTDSSSLAGVLYLMDDGGNRQVPSTPVTIRIRGYGQETVTSPGSGSFKLPLPETFRAGDSINLSVALEGYEVVEPPGGWLRLPDNLTEAFVTVILKPGERRRSLVRNDALRAKTWLMEMNSSIMTSERYAGLGSPAQERAATWLGGDPQEVDFSYEQTMIEYEASHGRDRRLIVEALAQGRHEEALAWAEEGVLEQERLLREAEAEGRQDDAEQVRGKLVWFLQTQGQALVSKYDFDGAVDVYTRALRHVSRERRAFSWARLHHDLSLIYVAMAEMGQGAESRLLLDDAMVHLDLALEAFTREHLPEYWAMAQATRGNALRALALMERGDVASQRLKEAVLAYQRALEVWEAERQPLFLAFVQHEMGQTLVLLGLRVRGEEEVQYLRAAIACYTQILDTFTRHRAPMLWAYIQVSLGQAKALLASREVGDAQAQSLAEAQAATRQALQFISIERDRISWLAAQHSLSLELRERGMNSEGEEAVRVLRQAVEVSEQMLQFVRPERERTYWLMAKLNLGSSLMLLSPRLLKQGKLEEGLGSLKSAKEVFLEILESVEHEHDPQVWLKARSALCVVHQALGLFDPGQEGVRLLEGAVVSCREAGREITPQSEPELWPLLQHIQGETLVALGQRLEALTRESLSRSPGEEALQVRLAESLLLQKRYSESQALLSPLLGATPADARTAVRLRVLAIVTLLAQGERGRVREELGALRALIDAQPESFSGEGGTEGLEALVNHEEELSPWREWLGELLQVLSARGRATMLEALDSCGERYEAMGQAQ